MRLEIKTVFENVDQEWLDWYLARLENEEVLPGSTLIVKQLKEIHHAAFSSKDPSSDVVATTSYLIRKSAKPKPAEGEEK